MAFLKIHKITTISVVVLLFTLLGHEICFGENILFVAMANSASHRKSLLPLAESLGRVGHNVTMFGEFIEDESGKGKHIINRFVQVQFSMEQYAVRMSDFLWVQPYFAPWDMYFYWEMTSQITDSMLEQKRNEFDAMLNSNWDLIFVDSIFAKSGIILTSLLKNTPYVLFETTVFGAPDYLDRGMPFPIATFPAFLPQSYTYNHKLFFDRISSAWNELRYIYAMYMVDKHVMKGQNDYGTQISVSKFYGEADGLFVGYPMGPDYPRPKTHDLIEIAGDCKSAKLTDISLLEFVEDEMSQGTIVIAFGHTVKWDAAPNESKLNFATAINLLVDYRVIWQFIGQPPITMGAHVRTMGWLPQIELLHHPKTKVFVSHGGLKSVMETICSQVPMVIMPIFAEQIRNWFMLKRVDAGLVLDKSHLSVDNIYYAIDTVASNVSYHISITKLKLSLLERPISPRDNALFWTEFMIRHKGLPKKFFQLKGYQLSWIQYFYVDVLAACSLIFGLVFVISIRLSLICIR